MNANFFVCFPLIYFTDVRCKNKFWGKSMEIVPVGSTHVTLPGWVLLASFTLLTGHSSSLYTSDHVNIYRCHMTRNSVWISLCRFGDHYEWNKVTSCIHNILSGQRWIEHYGEITIRNSSSDICQCKITFVKVRQACKNAFQHKSQVE